MTVPAKSVPEKLRIDGVSMMFETPAGAFTALADVTLVVPAGRFVSLIGPSGCGKSTIFNVVAGLQEPSAGRVVIDGVDATGTIGRVGYMLQKDLLLPWRTLLDNIILGMEIQGVPLRQARETALPLLRRYGLAGFERAYPHQLSGGMRQRANIIRTLIYEPSVILMDEPFGPLDAQTRLSLQALLVSIWESQRSTVLFVTHDLTEAIALADRVVLMSARPGRIVRADPVEIPRPRDIFYMHDQPEFRRLYDTLWHELAAQLDGLGRSTH